MKKIKAYISVAYDQIIGMLGMHIVMPVFLYFHGNRQSIIRARIFGKRLMASRVYSIMTDMIKPGDIVFSMSSWSGFGHAARGALIAKKSGENVHRFSHASMVNSNLFIGESVGSGVRMISLERCYIVDPFDICVLRCHNPSVAKRAAELFDQHYGRSYSLKKALLSIKNLNSTSNFARNALSKFDTSCDEGAFCSELVAEIYAAAGICFSNKTTELDPNILYELAINNGFTDVTSEVLRDTYKCPSMCYCIDGGAEKIPFLDELPSEFSNVLVNAATLRQRLIASFGHSQFKVPTGAKLIDFVISMHAHTHTQPTRMALSALDRFLAENLELIYERHIFSKSGEITGSDDTIVWNFGLHEMGIDELNSRLRYLHALRKVRDKEERWVKKHADNSALARLHLRRYELMNRSLDCRIACIQRQIVKRSA